jgi:hydroxypyruvate isomerase
VRRDVKALGVYLLTLRLWNRAAADAEDAERELAAAVERATGARHRCARCAGYVARAAKAAAGELDVEGEVAW